MIRIVDTTAAFALAMSTLACSPTPRADNELARENAESNALIEAAKRRLEASSSNGEDFGKPLPPLPGVHTPASVTNGPEAKTQQEAEHHHPE
jgi:hypothetical protein